MNDIPLNIPVLAVVSPKGGNGKTTVAVNLAVALARRIPSVLIDFDIHFGDVEYALGLQPIHRLDSVIEQMRGNSSIDIDSLLDHHFPGLSVLCAPSNPLIADKLDARECFEVVDYLRDLDRPLVLDTAAGLSEYNIGAIERSTRTILVTNPDVASVQASRKLLNTMNQFGLDARKIQLVINKADTNTGLRLSDVEEALERTAVFTLPDNFNIACSSNRGEPITSSQQNSQISKVFFSYVDSLVGMKSVEKGHHRLFARNAS